MIKKKKYNKLNFHDEHHQFLVELPKIIQKAESFKVLYSPQEFNNALLYAISQACHHICLVTLYLEDDQGGKKIIDTIFQVKKLRPQIKIKILVDWYRAQRSRIGTSKKYTHTNADWYEYIIKKYPNIENPIFGIPININEVLGVLHLKGFIIDDQILYSGANLSNEYLHINKKYRYDRYHIIRNQQLSEIMLKYIDKELLSSKVTKKLGYKDSLIKLKKNSIRLFRRKLRKVCYYYQGDATFNELAIIPLVGLGKNSILNQTIYHLISSTKNKMILCTPYFNMPKILINNLSYLLRQGKNIEIIVGDKKANDFYIPEHQPFKLIGILPYLYEVNLRYFLKKLQNYIDNKQLIIRLWKEGSNGFHIKGIWIDDEWQLLTGNNLNLRALKLDLENALLIHDPHQEIAQQKNQELNMIRMNTHCLTHYKSLQDISDYPKRISQLINKIYQIKFNRIINYII